MTKLEDLTEVDLKRMSCGMTTSAGQPRQDSPDRTGWAGQTGLDRLGRTDLAGQSQQDNLSRTSSARQPQQDSQCKTCKTAGAGELIRKDIIEHLTWQEPYRYILYCTVPYFFLYSSSVVTNHLQIFIYFLQII